MAYQCECGGDGQVCWTCYEKAREERDKALLECDRLLTVSMEATGLQHEAERERDTAAAKATVLESAVVELAQAREALKAAHHALTTVHGLWATDKTLEAARWQGDPCFFRIDKAKVLAQIEAALEGER